MIKFALARTCSNKLRRQQQVQRRLQQFRELLQSLQKSGSQKRNLLRLLVKPWLTSQNETKNFRFINYFRIDNWLFWQLASLAVNEKIKCHYGSNNYLIYKFTQSELCALALTLAHHARCLNQMLRNLLRYTANTWEMLIFIYNNLLVESIVSTSRCLNWSSNKTHFKFNKLKIT